MSLRVEKIGLRSSLHFLVAVRRDDLAGVVLRHPIDSFERLGQSCRVEAID